MSKMPIGARVIKTGLAATLAILICRLFIIEPASFAAITAVVNMQPSVNKALKNAWEQITVHIIAVILAIILGIYLGNAPWVIGLAVILIIVIANRIGWTGAITLGIVSIIFILDAPPEDFLLHAGVRSLAIFIGLGVALVINRVLAPPKYRVVLRKKLIELFTEASSYFLMSLRTFASSNDFDHYEQIKTLDLEVKLQDVMKNYEFARDELGANDNALLIERLIEVCRGLIERGQIIEDMTKERIKRRRSPNAPIKPQYLSTEFQRILELLILGAERVEIQRDQVLKGLDESHLPGPKGNDLEFWAEFDEALSVWQQRVNGEFYLRAMMEVVVVASEMRWVFRRLRTLYNLSSTDKKDSERITITL